MPDTVRIYGSAGNIRETPPCPVGTEVWLANNPTTVMLRRPRSMDEWTRWFNLHSRAHILGTYPSGYHYYQTKAAGRPIYLLKAQPDIPTSIAFPYERIQKAFPAAKRYFTCTVCWLIAFAVVEGFKHIELWGFELRDTKPGSAFALERPCFFYWIKQARERGVEVVYQEAIKTLPFELGDPDTYDGPLYGYDTRPEEGWDKTLQKFVE